MVANATIRNYRRVCLCIPQQRAIRAKALQVARRHALPVAAAAARRGARRGDRIVYIHIIDILELGAQHAVNGVDRARFGKGGGECELRGGRGKACVERGGVERRARRKVMKEAEEWVAPVGSRGGRRRRRRRRRRVRFVGAGTAISARRRSGSIGSVGGVGKSDNSDR
jgi:hypothetical protein